MIVDVAMILAFMFYSAFGAITRALFGIYKAYSSVVMFKIDWARVGVEIVASMFFGTFSSILLQEVGGLKVGMTVTALIAGFFGADLIALISKKVGLTKGIEVRVTEQEVGYADFNERQIAALQYLKTHKRLTNKMYRKLTQASRSAAKRDLAQLVSKEKIRKISKGRYAYYEAG